MGATTPEMGTAVNKPNLADVMSTSVWNPITGGTVRPIGYRRNGAPIYPVIGGSQPLGGPVNGSVQPQAGQLPGQQPGGPFMPGLGGQPVPVLAPGVLPAVQPQPQQAGQVPFFGPAGMQPAPVPMFGQQPGTLPGQPVPQAYGQQPYGQGAPPAMPYGYGQQPQFPFTGQPGVMPGALPVGQPAGVQPGQQNGQQQPGGQPGQQQQVQQSQGGAGGQNDGVWDKPYPQKPLSEMTDGEQAAYWKFHHRKGEDRIRQMADYDQVKAQLGQLQQLTQTEWQRAVLEAENRGASRAMDQAGAQMVAVAFQGAANGRMSPDQITAALARLDSRSFVQNGQVDIAAVHQYVDMIAPARNPGLVPLLPQQQQGQLPVQQVTLGYPQQPLQPGMPGYGQQPTFGPLNPQQPQYQPAAQYGQQVLTGQVMGPQPGYGPVPVPGVPQPYQPAAMIAQPVIQASGLNGLPGLNGRQPGLPAAADFGQGPAVPGPPANAMQSGAAMAAARHGRTRSQQIAATR